MPGVALLRLLLEVLMKLAQMLPGFLRQSDVTQSTPILSEFVPPASPAPSNPFDAMEAHLAVLIAAQTAAQAEAERTVRAVNDYMEQLKLTVETQQKSVAALYTQAPKVKTES